MLIVGSSCSLQYVLPFRLLNIFPILFSLVISIVQCFARQNQCNITTRQCRFQFLLVSFKHSPECVLVCTWALRTRTEIFFLASYLIMSVYMVCIPSLAIPQNIRQHKIMFSVYHSLLLSSTFSDAKGHIFLTLHLFSVLP